MRWTLAIVAGWGALLLVSMLQLSLPASWWFDVGAIHVEDTTTDHPCTSMDIDRSINRAFKGYWTLTIMRQKADGSFYTYRTFAGQNDYNPDNQLPEVPTLCWWAESESIWFLPGTYRVHVLWELDVDGGVRGIRRRSNSFIVNSKGES